MSRRLQALGCALFFAAGACWATRSMRQAGTRGLRPKPTAALHDPMTTDSGATDSELVTHADVAEPIARTAVSSLRMGQNMTRR